MARKNPSTAPVLEIDYFDRVKAEIDKLMKTSVISDASLILDEKKRIIPISPVLDYALNGGVPEGSSVTISGDQKFGKSVTSLHFAGNAQKPENGGKDVYYLSIENRLKEMNISGAKNLNPEKLKVVRSTRDKIISAEEFLSIGENIIRSHPGAVIILDSVSTLCNSGETTSDLTGQYRTTGPKLLSLFYKRNGQIIRANDTIVVSILHLIANTSGYGSPYLEDSGRKVQYDSDIKLRGRKSEKWEVGGEQIGQIAEWEILWSALGPPGRRARTRLRYGHGIDEEMEIVDMGTDFGVIEKAGSWYTVPGSEQKIQGEDNLREFLMENPDIFSSLRKQVNEIVGVKREN